MNQKSVLNFLVVIFRSHFSVRSDEFTKIHLNFEILNYKYRICLNLAIVVQIHSHVDLLLPRKSQFMFKKSLILKILALFC